MAQDRQLLFEAIELSRKCVPSPTAYCVGAVVITADGSKFTGYTHETGPAKHAEEEAIAKAEAVGAQLHGAAIYSSMEPCTHRVSKPISCSRLIIEKGFSRVVYALAEPPELAQCQGYQMLSEAGLEVVHVPELGAEVRRINAHILKG